MSVFFYRVFVYSFSFSEYERLKDARIHKCFHKLNKGSKNNPLPLSPSFFYSQAMRAF